MWKTVLLSKKLNAVLPLQIHSENKAHQEASVQEVYLIQLTGSEFDTEFVPAWPVTVMTAFLTYQLQLPVL